MLDITTISRVNVSSVVGYYADAKDDYYSKDSNFTQWHGTGADALGLNGEVDSQRFKELLVGEIDHFTQMKRDQRDQSKERLAYDFTFSSPKGVSLQALVHGDQAIIDAHEKAVAAALKEAEGYVQARETKNGNTRTMNTGNLVAATFRHETSRALDPELHTHAVVMNMTQRQDGQWRSIKNDELFKQKMHLGDVYKEHLAVELVKQGFELRFDQKNGTFDLAHFSPEQIKGFSSRGTQIEQTLEKMGLDRESASADLKSQIALSTRQKKVDVSREEIYKQWNTKAKELGIDFEDTSWKGKLAEHSGPEVSRNQTPNFTSSEVKADRAISFAIKSLSERDASFPEAKLLAVANKNARGHATSSEVTEAYERALKKGALITDESRYTSTLERKGKKVHSEALTAREWVNHLEQAGYSKERAKQFVIEGIESGRLERKEPKVTTPEGINVERSILKIESRGRGVVEAISDREYTEKMLASKTLKPEQLQSVLAITSTTNRFMSAHGYAGTGKSYMTVSAKEVIESQGYTVKALAPYGTQKKSLEEEGLSAQTVAAFLKSKDKKLDEKTVIFIDEAGVIPAKQMKALMTVIEESGARAVFLGDTSQTKAVEAGKPFEQLIKAGMETTYLKDIQRQKNEALLEAVKDAAEGNTYIAVSKMRNITEEKNEGARLNLLAQKYLQLSKEEQDNTLIISGTNKSRVELNTKIRDELGLSGKGEVFTMLERVDSTQVERHDSRYYQKGQVIIPEKDYKNGLERGKSYTITDTGPGNKLTVTDGENVIAYSPRTFKNISVYEQKKSELAPGDKVMITRNDKDLDVANGDRFTVKSVREGSLVLENEKGRQLDLSSDQSRYLAYAYATTVHKSQGLTCDRVLFNLDTESLTTSKDVFYVGISRARHSVDIFTDDEGKLATAVGRNSPKTTATEVDRFMGLEERFKPVEKDMQHDTPKQNELDRQVVGVETAVPSQDQEISKSVEVSAGEKNLSQEEQRQAERAIAYADNHEYTPELQSNPYEDYAHIAQEFEESAGEMDYSGYEDYAQYEEPATTGVTKERERDYGDFGI